MRRNLKLDVANIVIIDGRRVRRISECGRSKDDKEKRVRIWWRLKATGWGRILATTEIQNALMGPQTKEMNFVSNFCAAMCLSARNLSFVTTLGDHP